MAAVGQPSGKVTFVLTDIEGSTALLESLGPDAYREALARHRDIVRDAFDRHAGYEVNYEGDAFFYAFASPRDAVGAVSEAMHELEPGPIRVRVGMHTGEATLDPPKYVGMDVHRAARIMAAAHGGQVVLSRAAAESLPDGFASLVDLGEHRLKDLPTVERLFQLDVDGLACAFPPLRSLHRASLPVPPTPFRGRTTELARTVRMLTDPTVRLLTLTGPGGVGKTRLGLRAAEEAIGAYPDGVTCVELAPIDDPNDVPGTVARALGLQSGHNVEAIVRTLTDTTALLMLDNCEHVLDGVARVVRSVVEGCPHTVVLATSREPIRLRHEHRLEVMPLEVEDAERLFVERARAMCPDFLPSSSITAICEALDRLPLAIELAAARVRTLTPPTILAQITQPQLLVAGERDRDERHRSLEAAIAWSYDLLDEEERRVLRALTVFAGGCTLEGADAVGGCGVDILESLIDKSLVTHVVDGAGQDRYAMLETISQFAAGRVGVDEADALRTRHGAYFVDLARRLEPPRFGAFDDWERVFADDRNFRLALRRALDYENADQALAVVRSLADHWFGVGDQTGTYRLARRALALPGGDALDRAHAEARVACIACDLGRLDEARALWAAAERCFADADDPRGLWRVANDRAYFSSCARDAERALGLARSIGDPCLEMISMYVLAATLEAEARRREPVDLEALTTARSLEAAALASFATHGTQYDWQAVTGSAGFSRLQHGELADALDFAQRAVRVQGRRAEAHAWREAFNVACVASRVGWHRTAATLMAFAMRCYARVADAPAPWDAPLIEEVEVAAKAALGDRAYADAVSEGEALSLGDAVGIVLALDPERVAAATEAAPASLAR